MYSREFHSEGIPPGYGGNAFSAKSSGKEEPEKEAAPCFHEESSCTPPPQKHQECCDRYGKDCGCGKPDGRPGLFDRWRGGRWHDLLSGDLLLVVVAVLLLTGQDDSCEEGDDDLWLLLLLIYFMR